MQTAPTKVTYYDVLDRVVLSQAEALDSADGGRRPRTESDSRNRVKYVSVPYFSTHATTNCKAAGAYCTWYSYDVRNRVTREDQPDGGYTITEYADSGAAGAVAYSDAYSDEAGQ